MGSGQGQIDCVDAFVDACKNGKLPPIPLEEIFEVTKGNYAYGGQNLMFAKGLLYFHTVRYLKPKQIYARLTKRLVRAETAKFHVTGRQVCWTGIGAGPEAATKRSSGEQPGFELYRHA